MRAVRLHAFGPAENLRTETVPDPEPGPGQVRIAVAAAGVHLIDTVLRAGVPMGPLAPPELPTVPGREVAGRVDALGAGTDPGWLGRDVVAHLGTAPGGYAERAVVAAEALLPVPEGLSAPQAVAMIGTGRTAMGLVDELDIGAGDTVLVLAAAGGIGKTALVAELGADAAVDYTRPDWTDRLRAATGEDAPATYLFEGVGGEPARDAAVLLADGGTYVPYGNASTWRTDPGHPGVDEDGLGARGVRVHHLLGPAMQAKRRRLEERALALAGAGELTPPVTEFPLAEAAAAHRALEERATTGKVVLVP